MRSGEEAVEQINGLRQQSFSVRAISRIIGYNGRTVIRYLLRPTRKLTYRPRSAVGMCLDAQVLPRELRERNYDSSYTITQNPDGRLNS